MYVVLTFVLFLLVGSCRSPINSEPNESATTPDETALACYPGTCRNGPRSPEPLVRVGHGRSFPSTEADRQRSVPAYERQSTVPIRAC